MRKIAYLFAAAAGLLLTACEHYGDAKESRNTIPVDAAVTIAENPEGGYSFSYNAQFFKENGDFDFSQEGAKGNTIILTFTIADGSVPGIGFNADATDALWIVDKKDVDKETGSPGGPYRGNQFFKFAVSDDRQSLTVTDQNDDGVLYRYGLRLNIDGEPVIDDPDGQNGGHN